MTARIFLAVLSILAASSTYAQKPTRMLMHTFQNGRALVFVAVIDESPVPRGLVRRADSAGQRTFTVSHQQFEQMWRTLQSDAAQKYAGREGVNRTFDAINNYVFSVSYMPNGKKTNYVVPKGAPNALVSLARQLEGYARR
jgi:hypothetical protein